MSYNITSKGVKMKGPSSKGDGTTGAWKAFSDAFNRVGDNVADKRRKKYEDIKKAQSQANKKTGKK